MKKIIIVLTCIFGSISMYAQISIVLNSGEKIPIKRYVIKPRGEVLPYITKDGQKKEVKKAEVFCLIRGKNLFVFDSKGMPKQGRLLKDKPEMDPNNICSKAIVDAAKNYRSGGPGIGTGAVSFIAWPVGLITAAVVSSAPPATSKLKMDQANASDTQYCDCYKKEAHKKKSGSAWMGWGLGTALGCAVGALIMTL
jgi:hypothetical protein